MQNESQNGFYIHGVLGERVQALHGFFFSVPMHKYMLLLRNDLRDTAAEIRSLIPPLFPNI